MKKVMAILLVLCVCLGVWGCSYSEAELAEIETVKSNLAAYSWAQTNGGVAELYNFKPNGTLYGVILYSDYNYTEFEGTYEIDPSSNKIEIETDGSSYAFSYSLSGSSMKLYDSGGDSYDKIDKED